MLPTVQPASGQNVPPDFEVVGVAGGLGPGAVHAVVRIGADGQGAYREYEPGDPGAPVQSANFAVNAGELGQLWQAIQANGFFGLNAAYTGEGLVDGTLVRLTVTANGNTHTVRARNVGVDQVDAIVSTLNAVTPGTRDLVYAMPEPVAFTPLDICEQPGKRGPRRLSKTGESGERPTRVSATARPRNGAAHPGTFVGYHLTLQEAVDQGIVTLSSKGEFYGDAVSITIDNTSSVQSDKLQLSLYLEFWGPTATTAAAQQIEQAIESTWGGKTTSGGQAFDVDVVTRTAVGAAAPPGTAGYHQIKLVGTEELSHVDDLALNEGVSSGVWETASPDASLADIAAHEAGHLMGLEDTYDLYTKQEDGSWVRDSDSESFTAEEMAALLEETYSDLTPADIQQWLNEAEEISPPMPGSEDDIMGSDLPGSHVQQEDIDFIASQAGLVIEIRPGDVLLGKDASEQSMVITRTEDVFVPAGETTTLNGLYAACIDEDKLAPDEGDGFDVAPSLSQWRGIEAAGLLQQLVEYIDRTERFCGGEETARDAVWRITDNTDRGLPHIQFFLATAGIDVGTRFLDFPRLSHPHSGDQGTGLLVPPELLFLDAASTTGDVLRPGQTVSLTGAVGTPAGAAPDAWAPASAFSWTLTPPAGSAVRLSAAQGPNTSFTPDIRGIYRVHGQVEATDGRGATRELETDLVFMAADDHTETFENGPPMHRGTLQWLTNDFRWELTEGPAHTGAFSLGSADIGNGQVTIFGARFEQVGPGSISFAFKVSSEAGHDGLVFVVNDEPANSWSGQPADWDTYAVDLPAGSHTVLWAYQKDGSFSSGEDRAWIDDVVFPDGARVVALEASAPDERPAAYRLDQNYPNPFNPTTTITYAIPEAEHVRLVVYDAAGREVAVLVEGRREAGAYRVRFDARTLSNGVYYYELRAGAFVERRSMVLVK